MAMSARDPFGTSLSGEALDAILVALSGEAQRLILQACDLCVEVGACWESEEYASVVRLMREAAAKHRRVAELYETIADRCTRAKEVLS